MTRINRIFGPMELMFLITSWLAVAASVLRFPVELRFPIVLGYLLIIPGYAFVRMVNLEELAQVLMLSLATSIGIASAVSVVALYAGLWNPDGILAVICVITVLAAYGKLWADHIAESRNAD